MSEPQAPYTTDAPQATRFAAQVFKVQTLIDGGIRLTLDLVAPVDPQTIIDLFDAKQPGIILEVAAVAIDLQNKQDSNGKPELDKRQERKSKWTA